MVERRTRVVIEAQAKGFEQAKRAVKGTFDPAKRGAKDTEREMKGLDKTVETLTKHLDVLNKAFKGGGTEGKRALAELRRELKALDQDMRRMTSGGGRGGGGVRGGFGSGLMSGMGMGDIFPQQGFGSNVAGRVAGRGARRGARMAGGFAAAGFSGMGGMATALQGIPVVGGFMAGQLQNVMATSGAGIQSIQQRQALMPSMNAAEMAMDLERARSGAREANPLARMDKRGIRAAGDLAAWMDVGGAANSASARLQSTVVGAGGGQDLGDAWGAGDRIQAKLAARAARSQIQNTPGLAEAEDRAREAALEGVRKQGSQDEARRQRRAVRRSEGRRNSAVGAAERKVRDALFNPLLDIASGGGGQSGMGVGPAELYSFAGGLANTSGVGLKTLSGAGAGRSFFRQALGAQQNLGLDQGISGAFAKGSRQGVLGGGLGGAEASFTKAIGDAMRLGLNGSELTHFMQMSAQSLSNFEQTGMPLDPAAIGGVGLTLARAGLGGVRGGNVGQALLGAGQQLGASGPSSAVQLLMFQKMYGFKSGSGIKGFAGAQRRAEGGKISEGGFQSFIQALLKGSGSDDEGQLRLKDAFNSLGVNISSVEAFRLSGGDPATTKKIRKDLAKSATQAAAYQRGGGPAGFAEQNVDAIRTKVAQHAREKNAVGRGVAGAALTFEDEQLKVTRQFARLAKEVQTITKTLGGAAEKGSKTIVDLIKVIEGLVEKSEGVSK